MFPLYKRWYSVPVPSLTSRCQYDAGDLPRGGERLFLHRVEERETQERWGSRNQFPPPNTTFSCSHPLLSSSLFACVSLDLRVCFTGVLFTWPPERGRSWQPSRPGAWRARLQGRRDPGRRSNQACVPETHRQTQTHTQRVKIIIACADCNTLILCSNQTSRQNMACRWTRRWEVKRFLVEVKMK